jgi:2-(1,2-epoxy-1,2-dihydrophenyl)acetyl-CoA isomerase
VSEVTLVERKDGLVTITFNRPHRKNAINATNWTDLEDILTELEIDPTVRAVVFTGAEGNFSAGADLAGDGANAGITGRGQQPIVHEMRIVGRILARIKNLPKPTIAAVDGVCVGVGLGIALACDLIVATDRARFIEIFVKRGLALDGGTSWTLPHTIGLRRAKQMAYFGEAVDAATALEWGLINEVVAPEDLASFVEEWGARLANGPTTALSLIKSMLDGAATSSFEAAVEAEATAQHIVFTTTDLREGFQAFLERRDPQFTGT